MRIQYICSRDESRVLCVWGRWDWCSRRRRRKDRVRLSMFRWSDVGFNWNLAVWTKGVLQYILCCSIIYSLLGTTCLLDCMMLIKVWTGFFLSIASPIWNLLPIRHMLLTGCSLMWLRQRYITSDIQPGLVLIQFFHSVWFSRYATRRNFLWRCLSTMRCWDWRWR